MNLGNCFYCNEPVEAAPGQLIKHLTRVKRSAQGEELERKVVFPTHKKCRKLST